MACSYLLDQAVKRIWSSPRQDTQSITKPKRITNINGTWNHVYASKDKYILPLQNTRFHVYQIGQLYPLLMGLFPRQDRWMNLAEVSMQQKMICNVYSNKGIELPRFECWYLATPDRNLLLAVKEQPSIDFDLNTEDLYFRVYTNAYFQANRYNDSNEFIHIESKRITNTNDLADIKTKYEVARVQNMNTPILYVNGRKTNVLNANTVKEGDVVEYFTDSSIYRFVEWRINDLRTFDSLRDLKRKYLLHYHSSNPTTKIDYNDDIDFYIVRKDPHGVNPATTGFYYHRNQADAIRNLTHRDYSITVPYVTNYMNQETPRYFDDKSSEGWYVQMYVRHSGWERKLEYTHDRHLELYKLPDEKIVRALLGIESTVPEWRADNLENSDYMRLIGWPDYNIDQKVAEDAFGYNAVSVMVGNTPQKVRDVNGAKVIDLPTGLQRHSSAFEYDRNGKLLGYYNHALGETYTAKESGAALVEMIGGYASNYLDESYNQRHVSIKEGFNYRFYRRIKQLSGGGNWEDVTDTASYIVDKANNRFEWVLDLNEYDVICRSDSNILMQEYQEVVRDGLLYFRLNHVASRTGVAQSYGMEIPLGEIEVWLNGYSLVEGIDYFVDFPNVCIVNKYFLDDPNNKVQRVVVRQFAHPIPGQKRNPVEDTGWVQYGLLSRNNRFDIRDDRVMRVMVGGAFIHRDDLGFSDEDSGVRVRTNLNGRPYCIKDIPVLMRNVVLTQNEYEYRERSRLMDNKISDYMSQYLKDPVIAGVSSTQFLWPLYSPFCSKVIADLRNGSLSTEPLTKHYDDNFVLDYLKSYNYLLKVDPTQDAILYDKEFAIVHPTHLTTVVDLNPWQYKFMERVISLILKGRVDLTSFARITA